MFDVKVSAGLFCVDFDLHYFAQVVYLCVFLSYTTRVLAHHSLVSRNLLWC